MLNLNFNTLQEFEELFSYSNEKIVDGVYNGINEGYLFSKKTVKLFNSAVRAFSKIKNRKLELQTLISSRQFMGSKTKSLWKKTKSGMFEPTLASFIISDI